MLNLIREAQPISRAELARRMNVRRASLTTIVRELLAAGDVEETGRAASARGRRPTLLRIRTRGRLVVAVDVRPVRTNLALADFAGNVLERQWIETPKDPSFVADAIARAARALLDAHDHVVEQEQCHGIGIVVPGMVDRKTGRVLYAPRLAWRDVQLREAVQAQTGLPAFVESAPIACALARLWSFDGGARSASRVVNNFAYVSVSDGVGVGIVTRGEVMRGETNTAGELGHVSLDPSGPACACGRHGCWEAFSCNAATVARYGGGGRVSVEEIVRRAKQGEASAVATLIETGRQIGRGLAAVINAFNPKRIYVGGEITAAWELIEAPMREQLVAGTLTEATQRTPVYADANPGEYRLLGAVALVAAPTFAAPRVA
ncbi:MAG TPA: ROK family protein [Gemmatimonadaceae bacterium]|nr:ROK family protein [Gemmatimonadaceae bacterium]